MSKALEKLDEAIAQYVKDHPDLFYEGLLLGPLTAIYSAKKNSPANEWQDFSNLLVDKFAIHSLSFFHLSQGIVERKRNDETIKGKGYDIFSINALFRVLLETYIAFNWIFVAPTTAEEKEFRFLLWKLDGLFEKRKFEYPEQVKQEVAAILAEDEAEKTSAIQKIKQNAFYATIPVQELNKILDTGKNKAIWRYESKAGHVLRPLKITELIQMTCRMDGFLNMYRYASLYTHSSYASIDKFRQMRGRSVPDDYTKPLIELATYLTALVINDMCLIDQNAARALSEQEVYYQRFIVGISSQIKKIPVRPVK